MMMLIALVKGVSCLIAEARLRQGVVLGEMHVGQMAPREVRSPAWRIHGLEELGCTRFSVMRCKGSSLPSFSMMSSLNTVPMSGCRPNSSFIMDVP